MTEYEGFEDAAISMYDEDGNEAAYHILATKQDGESFYMLAEADCGGAMESEVLIFKCITGPEGQSELDEMVFELVDESHASLDFAISLFKEDFEALGIEY